MSDFTPLVEYLRKAKQERELDKILGPRKYETISIPEKTCPVCQGTRFIEESGDLHRSAGIIPCPHIHCEGGKVRRKTVEVKRRIRVKAISRKIGEIV